MNLTTKEQLCTGRICAMNGIKLLKDTTCLKGIEAMEGEEELHVYITLLWSFTTIKQLADGTK